MNISSVRGIFESMLELLGNVFMAFFSVLFISFFLIRDKDFLKEKSIQTLGFVLPKAKEKINTIIYFIRRYVIGLCLQTILLFILFGFGMTLLDLPNPWTLAVFAAVIVVYVYRNCIYIYTYINLIHTHITHSCLNSYIYTYVYAYI